jgi:hypothetical protein
VPLDARRAVLAGDEGGRAFDKAYRSRRPEERLAAVRDLARSGSRGTARLLAVRVLASEKDEVVLLEAVRALRRLPEGPGRDPVLGALGVADGEHRLRLIRALAPMAGDSVLPPLLEATRAEDPRVRAAATSGLAGREGEAVEAALLSRLRDPSWEVRAAAVGVLGGRVRPELLPSLVDRLEVECGRLREDLVAVLRGATGAGIGADPSQWRRWIRAHPAGTVPTDLAEAGAESAESTPECADGRTVYVLDLSRSMADPMDLPEPSERLLRDEGLTRRRGEYRRVDVARAILRRSLAPLDRRARVEIVTLNGRPRSVLGGLVPATERTVARTLRRLDHLSPSGPTDIDGGLRLALAARPKGGRPEADGPLGADRIVLISEGFACGGRLRGREAILALVREVFLERRVRIDAIGVGSCDVDLLEGLARATGGRFTRVGD